MKKVFSTLEIKSVKEKDDKRTFSGIASTPTPDRADDIVDPKGAQFKLPLPFLWQHNSNDPIGWVTKAKVTKDGIEVEGEIANIEENGKLKDKLDEAWGMLKNKLVRGLSIGFKILESARIAGTDWGEHITKWDWIELSAVTIPCNEECTILAVKNYYRKQFKNKGAFANNIPGVSGQTKRLNTMKNLREQLAELKDARALKAARIREISEAITNKSATNDDTIEFDALTDEIEQLDNDIRVKTAECLNASVAKPVVPAVKTAPNVIISSSKEEQEERETDPKVRKKNLGLDFTRMVVSKAVAQLEGISPVAAAQKRWGKDRPKLVGVIKASVEGGGTGTGEWGTELASADAKYTGDFIELLTQKTVYDKLPLREVPANVTIKGQDGAATGYWVGESAAIPVSAQSFSDVTLSRLKVGALAVISNELIKDSSPAALTLVRDQLVNASARRTDQTFVSATAASAGVSPAGILNGITPDSASGTDADSLRADIKTLYGDFISAYNASGLYFVMNPALAKSIQLLYNALGNPEFPGITQDGGTLLGDPVVTGDYVAADDLILLKPSDIYKIGSTGVEVSISREATIEMDDAPAMESQGPTTASGAIVGMFQTESTAIKVVRPMNFQVRRTATSVVGFVGDAAYDNSSS